MKFMVYVLLVAVLSLGIVVGYQFDSITKSRAEARQRNLETWHQVICSIEHTVESASLSDAKKRQVIKFYDGLLLNIGARTCGLENK